LKISAQKRETARTFYRDKARRFLNWLGPRADEQITLIEREDVKEFREFEMKRVSWRSTRQAIKFLRMGFKSAKASRAFQIFWLIRHCI